jgi:hypothetical protein
LPPDAGFLEKMLLICVHGVVDHPGRIRDLSTFDTINSVYYVADTLKDRTAAASS